MVLAVSAGATTDARLEFVIADDQSDEDIGQTLRAAAQQLRPKARIDIKVSRLRRRQGVPRARNHAAALATGEILFITDAHVQVSYGFDALILENVKPKRIIAGAITEANTPFIGYGHRANWWCRSWGHVLESRAASTSTPAPVQIAACPATALTRDLFNEARWL